MITEQSEIAKKKKPAEAAGWKINVVHKIDGARVTFAQKTRIGKL